MLMNSAVRLLDRAAARWPDRPALEDETGEYSYAEYRGAARRVGSGILALGIGAKPVVVCLQKSARVLLSFMGAMYAGCPYAPVDAAAPPARLEKIVGSLRPGLIIAEDARAGVRTEEISVSEYRFQSWIICATWSSTIFSISRPSRIFFLIWAVILS